MILKININKALNNGMILRMILKMASDKKLDNG